MAFETWRMSAEDVCSIGWHRHELLCQLQAAQEKSQQHAAERQALEKEFNNKVVREWLTYTSFVILMRVCIHCCAQDAFTEKLIASDRELQGLRGLVARQDTEHEHLQAALAHAQEQLSVSEQV